MDSFLLSQDGGSWPVNCPAGSFTPLGVGTQFTFFNEDAAAYLCTEFGYLNLTLTTVPTSLSLRLILQRVDGGNVTLTQTMTVAIDVSTLIADASQSIPFQIGSQGNDGGSGPIMMYPQSKLNFSLEVEPGTTAVEVLGTSHVQQLMMVADSANPVANL